MDPSPAFHTSTGLQSSATHKLPATVPGYLNHHHCSHVPQLNPPKPASAPPPARATWADISEKPEEELATLAPRLNKGKGKETVKMKRSRRVAAMAEAKESGAAELDRSFVTTVPCFRFGGWLSQLLLLLPSTAAETAGAGEVPDRRDGSAAEARSWALTKACCQCQVKVVVGKAHGGHRRGWFSRCWTAKAST